MEILLGMDAEHLHASAGLCRESVGIEIDVVLNVLDPDIDVGSGVGKVKNAAQAQAPDFSEIIFPGKMVRNVVVHQIWRRGVAEVSVGFDGHGVAEKPYMGRGVAVDFDFSGSRTGKSDCGGGLVVQYTSLLLGELRSDIEQVFGRFGAET